MKIPDGTAPFPQPDVSLKQVPIARGRACIRSLALVAGLVLSSGSLRAQVVWVNNGSSALDNTANWVGGSLPTGQVASFTSTTFSPSQVQLQNSNLSVAGISLGAGAGALTFTSPGNGGAKTLSIGSSGILNLSANTLTFDVTSKVNVTLTANATFTANGPIQILDDSPNGAAGGFSIGANTLTLAGTSTTSIIQKGFTGIGSIVKSGTGTWTLSGANAYSGGTTLSAGTLKLGNSNALGSGTLTMADGSALVNGNSSILTLSNSIATSGNVTFGGSGSNSGDLKLAGAISGSANLKFSSNDDVRPPDRFLTVYLQGNNTFSGSVNMTASSLILDSANALPSGVAVKLNDDGYIGYTENSFNSATTNFADFKAAITANVSSSRSSDTIIGIDSANTASPRTVSAPIDLTGISAYFGTATKVTVAGTISYNSTSTLPLTGVNGGYLKVTSPIAASGNITAVKVGNSESEPGDVTYKGYVELTGANSYAGGTTLKSGYLLVGNNSALGTGMLTVNGSADTGAPALAASANGITLANDITLAVASGNSTTSDNQLIVGVPTTATTTDFAFPLQSFASNNLTLSGNITETNSGTNSLSYVGSGTLTLSGNNTYTGATTVSSGTLVANNSASNTSATGSGAVTVAVGATLQVGTGGTTGAIAGNIVNNGAVIYNRSDNATYSGMISGTGSGTKLGAGTLTLSGSNTFSGGLNINAGQVSVSGDANLGDPNGALVLNNGVLVSTSTMTLGSTRSVTLGTLGSGNGFSPATGTTLTYGGAIGGSNGLTKYDNGTLILTGANTYTGGTTIANGTLQIGAGLTTGSITGSVVNNGTLTIARDDAFTFSNSISGTGGVKISTFSNSTALSGANSYTGVTDTSGGTLTVSSLANGGVNSPIGASSNAASNLLLGKIIYNGAGSSTDRLFTMPNTQAILDASGTGALSFTNPGSLVFTGASTFRTFTLLGTSTAANTLASVIPDNGGLATTINKQGTGTWVLSGVNTYTGATRLIGGTLVISAETNLGAVPGAVSSDSLQFSGGNLETTGTFTLNANRGITLNSSGSAFNIDLGTTLTAAGIVTGSAPLTKTGGGTLTLSGSNTYSGGTTINAGQISVSSDANLGASTGALALNNGVLLTSADMTLGTSRSVTLGTLGSSNGFSPAGNTTLTYGGVIGGSGGLTKYDNGTLSLGGANTFSGGTTVSFGSLVLTNTSGSGTGTGNVTIASGASLTVGNGGASGALTGNISNSGNVTFARSNPYTYGGVLSGFGQVNQTGAGTLTLSGANTYTGVTNVTGGTLAISQESNLGAGSNVFNPSSLTLSGGTLENTQTLSLSSLRGITLSGGGGAFNTDGNTTLTVSGSVTGGSGLTKSGPGTLVLAAANSYNGTTINAGELQLASTGSLNSGSDVTLNGSGVFHVFAPNQTIRDLISSSATSSVIIESGATLNSNMPNTPPNNLSTYAGSLSGAGSFLKNGGVSTLILTGNSTLTGLTTVSSGTLQIGNGGTTGSVSGNLAITSPGTFDFNRSDAPSSPITYSSVLSGNGSFVKDGMSTLILSGSANTFSGSAIVNAGALVVGADNVVPNAAVTVNANGTFSVSNNATINSLSGTGTTTVASGKALTLSGVSTLSSIISGAGGVTFGSGITVAANQAYTGVTSIPSGVLIIGNSTATATIAGNIATNPSSSIPSSINVQNAGPSTYAGIISGTGSLSLNGPGNLTLTGVNAYTGSTSINGGALIVGVDNAVPNVPNGFVSVGANGTFRVDNNQTISSLNGAGATIVAGTKTLTLGGAPLSSVISGAGNVALNGVVTMTANQTYTGNTVLNNTGNNLTLNLGNNTASGMVAGNIVTTTSKTGVQFNHNAPVTYGGVISGGGFVNKNNTNTLTLAGQNTYTGGTSINGGTLVVGVANALPATTSVSFGPGATLDVASDQTIAGFFGNALNSVIKIESGRTFDVALGNSATGTFFQGTITDGTVPGAGGRLKIGSNNGFGHPVQLVGDNTYTGGTLIDAGGKLLLGNNGTTGSIKGDVIDNGFLIFNRGDTMTFNGVISGNGSVAQGTLSGGTTGNTLLTGANSYTGGTYINGGALAIGDGHATGSITGDVVNNGTLAFYRSDTTSFGGVVSGTGGIVKQGTGSVTLTAQNTYTGSTKVNFGTLVIGVANALPVTTQLSLASGTALDVLNNQTIAGFLTAGDLTSALHLGTATTFTVAMPVANTSTTFAGTVNGDGTFAVSGAGGDVVNLTGTVANTVGTSVGSGATLNVASGGSVSGPISLGTGSSFTLGNSGTQTFTNVISGAGSIIASAGTTTLSAPNTYTGGTTISGGKIIVSNTSGSATGTGPVTVGNGGILGGSGIITGALTLNTGATVSPGNSPGLLTVGATTFANGATFAFDINNATGTAGTNWDVLAITGPLTISSTTANPFIINLVSLDFGNNAGLLSNFDPMKPYAWQFVTTTGGITGFSAGAFQYNASQFQNGLNGGFFFVSQSANNLVLNFSPVPEPSTWALLATGLGAFGFIALRRRRKA